MKKCLGSVYDYQTDSEPKIQDKPISHLQRCYIRNSNRGDVIVHFEQSDILVVEVHSNKYNCTTMKAVYLLMEQLRMLKAFGIRNQKCVLMCFHANNTLDVL